MKIIISHDVDHMTVWEHLPKDLILPKFIIRAKLELLKGKIGFGEFFNRMGDFVSNKWQRIDEVMDFNDEMGIKSSFFIGVNNGVGLSYPLKHAAQWVPKIISRGFEVGVHGIDFDSFEKIKKEHSIFQEISGLKNFGIRMHYLRQNESTFGHIAKSGYGFECSDQGFKNPYKIGDMWEFPLQIMDGWVMNGDARHQTRTFEETKEYTLKEIEKAKAANLDFLSILFHDRYMSSSFITWKKWYMWLIKHLKSEGYEFVTHDQAISELEQH